jgi:ubiquinone/menaquinone biosynthesis C-methylase UbiE
LISFQIDPNQFYEKCYDDQWGTRRDIAIPLRDALLRLRERISLSTRRERFFRRHLRGKADLLILDVACGYGRRLFTEYGSVVGLDVVLHPLYNTCELYDLCVHADAFSIPFPDDYFDYIVSSDFLGHVPIIDKSRLYSEFHRVLKPGGKMLHVIETDANNWHFRFAHRYPDLFQKYFVEGIGGHFGLELPSKAIRRLESSGFSVLEATKIWGELWEVQGYKVVFDNEYKQKSRLIRAIVTTTKLLSSNILTQEVVNVLLNPVSALAESLTPLDNGQGLMVLCQKE